jgi:hypothetical protein
VLEGDSLFGEKILGDVSKNDKLRSEEAIPFCARYVASGHRLVDGLRADAKDRRKGPTAVTQNLYAEVHNPLPGATDGESAAPCTLAHQRSLSCSKNR